MAMRDLLPGVLIGIGVSAVARYLTTNGGPDAEKRPLAKALVHAYYDLMDKVSMGPAEALERWRDLLAEVRMEREEAAAAAAAAAATAEPAATEADAPAADATSLKNGAAVEPPAKKPAAARKRKAAKRKAAPKARVETPTPPDAGTPVTN